MMFPPDPIRQKMLFKTEWRSRGVQGTSAAELAESMNQVFQEFSREGFNISQILEYGDTTTVGGPGVIVVAQRLSSPVNDPTPQGVPVPGTQAQQRLEVIYSYIEDGQMKQLSTPTLKEAVRIAVKDQEESATSGKRHPLGIHVTSVTTYGPGDFHVLREKL